VDKRKNEKFSVKSMYDQVAGVDDDDSLRTCRGLFIYSYMKSPPSYFLRYKITSLNTKQHTRASNF
jgi:hypothetical protein